MSQQQHHHHLSGAVVFLAFSIVTLAAVLAGIERGRSRRDCSATDCQECTSSSSSPAVTATAAAASVERSPAEASATGLPSADSGAVGEDQSLVTGVRGAADGQAQDPPGSPGSRRLEILVHNISHKDMVLSLRRTRRAAKPARPQQRPTGEAVSNVIDAVSFSTSLLHESAGVPQSTGSCLTCCILRLFPTLLW